MSGQWTKVFDLYGGYDNMYGAWLISDPHGKLRIVVDLQHYGSPTCDETFQSPQAEADAERIRAALSAGTCEHGVTLVACPFLRPTIDENDACESDGGTYGKD